MDVSSDVSTVISRNIRDSLGRRSALRAGPFTAAFDAHSDSPWRNYATPDDGAVPTPDDVAALVALFRRHERLPRLEYVPACAPEVEPALTAAGFTVEGRPPILVSSPAAPAAAAVPDGITVAVAATDADLWDTAGVQHAAYAEPLPVTDVDVDRLRAVGARGGVVVVARDAATGTAVGTGLVDRAGPDSTVGELAAVGVTSGYRRRGIGGALSAYLAAAAHTRGMSLVWLEADAREEAVYRRVGFVEVTRKLWISLR